MDLQFLAKTPLFSGITPEEIGQMLECLAGKEQSYGRDQVIFHAGDTTDRLGLVLSGAVNIERDDFWGSRTLLSRVEPGQVFAETYACVPGEPMLVNAVAAERTNVLLLDMKRALSGGQPGCSWNSRLIRNLLAASAQKNLILSRRIMHTSAKTIRGRLLSYLSAEADRQGSCSIDIPFNRQQLADYLSVDRSALSAELGKMQKDGILSFRKNHFMLSEEGGDRNLP
ncbi:MAG: Crp/Fnr family transcriptional regulator [Eubacteriales bacterium]|nr:Crp/Fnr family transcriptional regulator [Eubacteriales bacterium]